MSLDVRGPEIKKNHYVAGRGSGKTVTMVLREFQSAVDDPGSVGLILSPTYGTLMDVFLATWENIIPNSLYTYNGTTRTIELINGSKLILKSRHINNPRRGRDAVKGLNVNRVADDEAAQGFDKKLYNNAMACIRRPGKIRYYNCYTTPLLNEYHDVATDEGHTLVHCSSRDNPHNDAEFVQDLVAEMSAQEVEREVDGRWVALEGLIWKWDNGKVGSKVERFWPQSNVHRHAWNPDKPYYLFLDLGVGNGAYFVVQRLDANLYGQTGAKVFPGSVWVVVAELMPSRDGSASRAFGILDQHFGAPLKVVSGADMDTRASTDSKTARYFVRERWGGSVPIQPISGEWADKQVQHSRLSYLVEQAGGNRRLCVSKDLIQLDTESKRGIHEIMAQDTWPDNAGKTKGVYFNKEGRLEHARDALLYGAVGQMAPPTYNKTGRVAA